jgi:carbonic anhydrase
MKGTFAAAINCMDGRVQEPVQRALKQELGVDYVDMITEAGPSRLLAEGTDTRKLESIRDKLEISVRKHGSSVVAVVAHHDCAGNPADKAGQIEDVKQSIAHLDTLDFDVRLLGIWVDEQGNVEFV